MFLPQNSLKVPIVKMELTFDDQKMQFYPSYETIQDLLASIVNKITLSLQGVIIFKIYYIQWF
jgi:dynein heavy chain